MLARRQLSLDETSQRRLLRRQTSEVRPILAWQESNQLGKVEVVAKKIGEPRPPPVRHPRSPFFPQEANILLSRRQVAERLRTGWAKTVSQERQHVQGPGRQNLNIFLNKSFDERPNSPKTPELGNGGLRRAHTAIDTTGEETECISESSSSSESEAEEPPPAPSPPPLPPPASKDPPPRLSASARRAVFRTAGRQQAAVPSPEPRLMSAAARPPRPPPLQRSRSAPPRRPKSKQKSKPTPRRGVASGGEVVTMVSLVSPAASESEHEEEPAPFLKPSDQPQRPESPPPKLIIPNPPPPPLFILKKPPKAVTFEPAKILLETTAQYKTSYPRRQSSTPGLLRSCGDTEPARPPAKPEVGAAAAPSKTGGVAKPQRQQGLSRPAGRQEVARRQAFSRIPDKIEEEAAEKGEVGRKKETVTDKPKDYSGTEVERRTEEMERTAEDAPKTEAKDSSEEAEGGKDPDLKSPKERECWQLFKRMSSSGVSVSFETVLRGLLTPTEYRMRRAALLATC